ncbi:MAG: DUF4199 domain-containing protein [Bacteroidales bacterium]|nr:DUF4199 domain-containing protein [Bacteroidales bacterium]
MSTPNNSKWSQAALNGLLLALITVVCNTITYLLPNVQIVNILMFIVRTVASIWLLIRFMKQYAAASGESAFGYGLMIVLFSSLVCAFYDAAAVAWLFPSMMDTVNEAMNQSLSMLPAESQDIAAKMMDNYPTVAFFSKLIGNFIIGLIVAAIANSSSKSKNIFDGEGNSSDDELA